MLNPGYHLPVLFLASLGLTACINPPRQQLSSVTIRDTAFHKLQTIEESQQLARFQQLWQQKTKADPIKIRWQYLLDISSIQSDKQYSTRWRYHPDGWAQVLSMKIANTYRLQDPKAFNILIGIKTKNNHHREKE